MYNLSPVPASFPHLFVTIRCISIISLYCCSCFSNSIVRGAPEAPTHTDDKSLSHFSSFPDFSVHIKVCLKYFPTICTNYTRRFLFPSQFFFHMDYSNKEYVRKNPVQKTVTSQKHCRIIFYDIKKLSSVSQIIITERSCNFRTAELFSY